MTAAFCQRVDASSGYSNGWWATTIFTASSPAWPSASRAWRRSGGRMVPSFTVKDRVVFETDRDESLIGVDGPQVRRDVAAVVAEGIEEAPGHVVERDIVIAGHDQLRAGEGIQEGAGLPELPGARALREIARHGDEVRIQAPDEREHGGHDGWVRPSEMDIRQMDDATHVTVDVSTTVTVNVNRQPTVEARSTVHGQRRLYGTLKVRVRTRGGPHAGCG